MLRLLLLSIAAATPVVAQGVPGLPRTGALQSAIGDPANVHLSGTLRTRLERIDGSPRPGVKTAEDLFLTRTTLLAEIGTGPVTFVGELWDSRAWTVTGASAAGTGEVNTFEPVEAFVRADLGPALGAGSTVSVQAGRMLLNIGTRRLIASDDYGNTTTSYTGVRVDVAPSHHVKATLLYVLPQVRLPLDRPAIRSGMPALDRESLALRLWGGYVEARNIAGSISGDFTALRLQERDAPGRPTRERDLTTLDAHVIRPPAAGTFDGEVEVAGQWGRALTSPTNVPLHDVAAWFVHADAGYSFKAAWKPRLSVDLDAASGDRAGGDLTHFDTLFGTRRADFSPGSIYGVVGRANMVAPALRLELTPDKRSDGFATARLLWAESASDVFSTSGRRDASGAHGRFAGYEFDSRVRHWLVPGVLRAEIDAVLLLRRGVLREAPGAPSGATTIYSSASLLTVF